MDYKKIFLMILTSSLIISLFSLANAADFTSQGSTQCVYDSANLDKLATASGFKDCYRYSDSFNSNTPEGFDVLLFYSFALGESTCRTREELKKAGLRWQGGIMQADTICDVSPSPCDTPEKEIKAGYDMFIRNYNTMKSKSLPPDEALTFTIFGYNRGTGAANSAAKLWNQGKDPVVSMIDGCYEHYKADCKPYCLYDRNGNDMCNSPGYGAKYPEKIINNYKQACEIVGGKFSGPKYDFNVISSQNKDVQKATAKIFGSYLINPSFNIITNFNLNNVNARKIKIKTDIAELKSQCENPATANMRDCVKEFVSKKSSEGWSLSCDSDKEEVFANFYDQYSACANSKDDDCICRIELKTDSVQNAGTYKFNLNLSNGGSVFSLCDAKGKYSLDNQMFSRKFKDKEYLIFDNDIYVDYHANQWSLKMDPDGTLDSYNNEFVLLDNFIIYKNRSSLYFMDSDEVLDYDYNSKKTCSIKSYTTRLCVKPCAACDPIKFAYTIGETPIKKTQSLMPDSEDKLQTCSDIKISSSVTQTTSQNIIPTTTSTPNYIFFTNMKTDPGIDINMQYFGKVKSRERTAGSVINSIVIHHTGDSAASQTINGWKNEETNPDYVSAHYVINKTGIIYYVIDEERRANHAGCKYPVCDVGTSCRICKDSIYVGKNDNSIGIEIVNEGKEPNQFTEEQYVSLKKLIESIQKRYNIPNNQVLAHCQIAAKPDPSKNFDWSKIALNNPGCGEYGT